MKETETERESDNKRLETDIDTSLAWTACTQFHLSPPSWMCFPLVFSQVLTSGNKGETDNDSNTAGPWIWNHLLSAQGSFLCKGATLQLQTFPTLSGAVDATLFYSLDISQVKYFLAISMLLVWCNVPCPAPLRFLHLCVTVFINIDPNARSHCHNSSVQILSKFCIWWGKVTNLNSKERCWAKIHQQVAWSKVEWRDSGIQTASKLPLIS